MYGFTYDISNKDTYYKQARQQAFADAKSKAQQYAALAGLSLGAPLKITESVPLSYAQIPSSQPGNTNPGQADVIALGKTYLQLQVTVDWSVY